MLIPLVFAIGVLFVLLGVTKSVGFQEEELKKALSFGFFAYGFLHLILALFLLTAPIPFGQVVSSNVSDGFNVSYTYVNVTANQSVDCNLTCIKEVPVLVTSTQVRFHEQYFEYSHEGEGAVNLLLVCDALVLLVYLFLFVLNVLKQLLERRGNEKE